MPRRPAPVTGPERDRLAGVRRPCTAVKAWWHREHPLAHAPRESPRGGAYRSGRPDGARDMLDVTLIRRHPDQVREGLRKRAVDVDIPAFLALDAEFREARAAVERLRGE